MHKKEKPIMNNGLKPNKVTVNIETMPYFSASLAKSKISPVIRVTLSLPENANSGKLAVSVVGKCAQNEFIRRTDFVKENLSFESFNFKNNSLINLDFDFDSFEYDYAFLNSIEEETMAEIYVLVSFGGTEYMAKSHVSLLPENMWQGLDGEPSVVCTFVNEDNTIREICKNICDGEKINYATSSKKAVMNVLKELYKRLKSCNIIYTRPVGYVASAKQTIRSPRELFSGTSILATPLEIALIFISCARYIGFDTSLLFVRGNKGEISPLCAVKLVKCDFSSAVCENTEKIKNLVDAGDMLVVDPSVFAAAQNTSFIMALEKDAEDFVRGISNLVCLVDIEKAKEACGEKKEDMYSSLNVKSAVANIYSSLVSSPIMQFLSGKARAEIEDIPLLIPNFDEVYNNENGIYKLLPLEFNVDLDDFACVDKNFSSIITSSSPKAFGHFSNSELLRIKERFSRFKEKISSDCNITTALRDEALYRTASLMAFGKNKKEPYFAFGYVKITDKLTELTSFAPICLVRASFKYENGSFFVSQKGSPIVNKVFIRNALKDSQLGYESFMKATMPTDRAEIFDMFENIRMALSETDDRHIYEIVREAHIINAEIDDYILWTSLARLSKKISQSDNAKLVFGEKKQGENINYSYVPSKPLYSKATKAVCNDSSVATLGAFTAQKEDVFRASAARSITDGKSMLVVTDDEEMSQYIYGLLQDDGMENMAYVVDCNTNSGDIALKISENLKLNKDNEKSGVGFISPELSEINSTLCDYTERINKRHSMGLSLREATSAYLGASCSALEYDNIPINESILEYADEAKLDAIFERVGELIKISTSLCKKSGLEAHTPLKEHPLFKTAPNGDLDDETKEQIKQAIENALPIISEYRDVFLDVNEILGFDESEINSPYKLEKLNDLYKLVLTSRDVDIPEKFVESDIEDFSKSKRFENENKKRMEAIEFKLNFFDGEIFEDVETLLRGDEYGSDDEKGFLKKFIHKKNGQETLLQYVKPEKKSEFQQHKVEEIFRLLYEYKSCVVALKKTSENATSYGDSTASLAKVSERASYFVTEIASGTSHTKKILSNVFRLISVIPVDSNLARRITVTRAKMAELYSGENSLFSLLSKTLGIDFDNLVFDGGILGFDGLSRFLSDIASKLHLTQIWSLWLQRSLEAREYVPGFVKYLEEEGATGNIDRILAKSLLFPVAKQIKQSSFDKFSSEKLGKAKDKYISVLTRACEISAQNAIESYKNCAKHLAETNVINDEDYANVSVCEMLSSKDISLVQKALPIIIIDKNTLPFAIPQEAMFDTVAVFDNKDNGFSMLPALSFGKRCMLFNMSRYEKSSLCSLISQNIPTYDVCEISSDKDNLLFSWLNEYAFSGKYALVNPDGKSTTELVRMNGTFERTTGRTNKTECELAIVKAANLLQDGEKCVVISAFTKEQCTLLQSQIYVLSKKNKTLSEALEGGRISVCTPDRLYMKKYDMLVVCACFASDKESRIGWDFGSCAIAKDEIIPEAYIALADRKTEKTYILTSLNAKDSRLIRRTGKSAFVFNSFCEILSDGRLSCRMRQKTDEDENSILKKVLCCIEYKNPKVILCEGKDPIPFALKSSSDGGAYVLFDNESDVSMHDELLVKNSLEKNGFAVTTVSGFSLVGDALDETLCGLVGERENI